MNLTFETIKKLIKEELSKLLRENEYGEEFNPQMEMPKDHGKIDWKHLVYDDEKNKPIYDSYVDLLIKHPWTLDEIIDESVEQTKFWVLKDIKEILDKKEEIDWDTIHASWMDEEDANWHMNSGAFMASKNQVFPFPKYLKAHDIAGIIVEKNPNDINSEIIEENKRMFYFIKALYEGKLPYEPEAQKKIMNDPETFNQAFSGYDGPSPKDEIV